MVSCDDADDFRRRCAADRYPKCSLFEEQAPSCGLPAHRTQSLEVVFEFQLYPLNLYSWSWPVVRPFEFSIEFDPLRRKYERVFNFGRRARLKASTGKFLNFWDVIKSTLWISKPANEFFPFRRKFEFILRKILNNTLRERGGGTGDSSPSPPTTSSPEIDVTHSRAWLKNVWIIQGRERRQSSVLDLINAR